MVDYCQHHHADNTISVVASELPTRHSFIMMKSKKRKDFLSKLVLGLIYERCPEPYRHDLIRYQKPITINQFVDILCEAGKSREYHGYEKLDDSSYYREFCEVILEDIKQIPEDKIYFNGEMIELGRNAIGPMKVPIKVMFQVGDPFSWIVGTCLLGSAIWSWNQITIWLLGTIK